METCDYRNLMLLHVEEDSVRKAPNSSTPPSAIDDWKLQGVLCDRVNRFLDRQDEPVSKFRANVVIPCSGILQLRLGLRQPYDRERHGFLNRRALTCSQGTTSDGFCSWRAIR